MASVLGIVAGGGSYPRKIVQQCQQEGRAFCILALEGQCEQDMPSSYPHLWISLGAIGKALNFLRLHQVSDVIFAGKVTRPSLSEIKPDLTGMVWLAKLAPHARGDDALLSAICRQFESEGFRILGSQDVFDSSFFAPVGLLTSNPVDTQAQQDIERGVEVLRCLGGQDVGQAIVVQQGMILGIEALEGTEGLIQRCAALQRLGAAGVLVKLSKISQDLRVDMPTVGPATIDQIVAAGFKGMALEANNVQIIDRDQVIAKANRAGLFILGLDLRDF